MITWEGIGPPWPIGQFPENYNEVKWVVKTSPPKGGAPNVF